MLHIDDFIEELRERRLRYGTRKSYGRLLIQFSDHCRKRGIFDASQIGSEALSFIDSLSRGRRITRSIRLKISRLKVYFQFLEEKGLIFLSPLKDYQVPEVPRTHYPVLSKDETEGFLEHAQKTNNLMIKGKAILELAYSSALRPRELYNLKITDIDFGNGMLFIRQSKNRKDRLVPVGRTALYWVDRYIQEVRPRYSKSQSHDYVFVSHRTGQPLTVYGIRWVIQETLRTNGLNPIKPYSLRGSAATHLLANGMGVLHISKLLGHENVTTTQSYLDIKVKDLQKKLAENHPRGRMEKVLQNRKENKSDGIRTAPHCLQRISERKKPIRKDR